MAMVGVLLGVGVATAQEAGSVQLDPTQPPIGPPDARMFSYQLTAFTPNATSWVYWGSNVIDASVDGEAGAMGWAVWSFDPNTVLFFNTMGPPPSPSIPLTGFHIVGRDVGAPGSWECGTASGSVEGPLPVVLTGFTAYAGDAEITLQWTTASELNNLAFHVYRALREEGPYERITAERIAAAGSSTMPRNYTFNDIRLKNGQVYYYKIQDISSDRVKEMHGPIAAKPAPPIMQSSWGAVKSSLG